MQRAQAGRRCSLGTPLVPLGVAGVIVVRAVLRRHVLGCEYEGELEGEHVHGENSLVNDRAVVGWKRMRSVSRPTQSRSSLSASPTTCTSAKRSALSAVVKRSDTMPPA